MIFYTPNELRAMTEEQLGDYQGELNAELERLQDDSAQLILNIGETQKNVRRLGGEFESAKKTSVAKLATVLTERLLTVGDDVVCQRAQLMLRDANGAEKSMGGRNRTSILNCILGTLYEYRVEAKPPSGKGD